MEMKQLKVEMIEGMVSISSQSGYSTNRIDVTPEQVSLLIQFLYEVIEPPLAFLSETLSHD